MEIILTFLFIFIIIQKSFMVIIDKTLTNDADAHFLILSTAFSLLSLLLIFEFISKQVNIHQNT